MSGDISYQPTLDGSLPLGEGTPRPSPPEHMLPAIYFGATPAAWLIPFLYLFIYLCMCVRVWMSEDNL